MTEITHEYGPFHTQWHGIQHVSVVEGPEARETSLSFWRVNSRVWHLFQPRRLAAVCLSVYPKGLIYLGCRACFFITASIHPLNPRLEEWSQIHPMRFAALSLKAADTERVHISITAELLKMMLIKPVSASEKEPHSTQLSKHKCLQKINSIKIESWCEMESFPKAMEHLGNQTKPMNTHQRFTFSFTDTSPPSQKNISRAQNRFVMV